MEVFLITNFDYSFFSIHFEGFHILCMYIVWFFKAILYAIYMFNMHHSDI